MHPTTKTNIFISISFNYQSSLVFSFYVFLGRAGGCRTYPHPVDPSIKDFVHFSFFFFFFLHNQQIFVLQYILNILLGNLFLVQGHFTLQEMFYLYKTLISLIQSLRRALYHIQCVVLWTGG